MTLVHVETCPFKTTLGFLFLEKSHNKFKSSPNIPFRFNLKIIPSCHTLSNAFDISRNTLLTLNSSSNDLYISCVLEKRWLTQEFPGLKADYFCKIRPFLMKNGNFQFLMFLGCMERHHCHEKG